jgi:FkbM family methyltransferase
MTNFRELSRELRDSILENHILSLAVANCWHFIPPFLRIRLPIRGTAIGYIGRKKFYWRLDPRELVSRKYFSSGFKNYEPETQVFLYSKLENSSSFHFLNVGANVGLWALLVGKKYGQIQQTLIEPVPTNLDFLRANILRNRIDARVLPIALGSRPSTTKIFLDSSLLGMATLREPINSSTHEIVIVEVVKGDDLVLGGVHCILIDVEGFEFEVLQGLRNTLTENMPIVIVEVAAENFDAISSFMAKIGYSNPIWLGKNWQFGPGEKNFGFEPIKSS